MDEEIKEVGEMATIEDEEEIAINEDYTTLEAETIIIDDDSNIQTDAEYEQAVEQKELADGAREALSAVLLSVLEKGEINDDDIAEIAAQQEIYTENVTALKILGLMTEDEKSTDGKSTTNVITSNIDYDELIKVLSEKSDWLYIDEDGQVMLNGEVVPKIKVIELEAEKVKADVGEFKDLTTENLTAVNARIDNLKAVDLTAVNADITNLKAQYAKINTLVNGHLTSDNIQSIVITGDKFTVANGFIKDAMIETLSASKINTGIINTNNVSIQSEDGSMVINGTTQQFKDKNNKVRIQIGKDATGNFTFALFSQDGKGVLIDETGIKSGAVPDGLIVNDMVADNANISGGKLDISSVISSINNNENTLNSSKIKFDDTNQTLDIAFNQLKSKVETIENITVDGDLSSVIEQVTTNTTNISVMQGQISSLISNTTITKQDGTVTQLKDEYNSIKDTVNSHTQTIGSLETNLSKAEDNIKAVTSKQSKFEQSLDGFKQAVNETYVTKTEVEKTLKSVTNEYYISTSNTELIDGSWSTTVPTPQANKYIWRREKSKFVDGSITYGDPICLDSNDGYTILLTKDTITCVWDSSDGPGGGGDSGGDNPSGGDSPALTISNISAKSIIEGAAFGISYTTNKTVSKHYISWNASSSSPTYTNITSYVSSSGNSHQYLENDNTQAVGTYNVAIKVVTADGESKISNIFKITITAPSSGGGDSGGETGSDLTGTYLFFGDSICYGGGTGGYGYPQAIKAKQPSMTSLNYSKSGTCIARNDSYDVKYPSILSKIQGTSIAADYIILEGGVNDSWGNRNPKGTFKGGTAPTTSSAMISYGNSLNEYQFADALEKCIIEIKLKWWGKKVFYVIPHPINQSYSNPYFNLAIQICNKWGVKVIDLRNSGCTSADTTDGTHPTRAAYDNYYAPNIINVLKANK